LALAGPAFQPVLELLQLLQVRLVPVGPDLRFVLAQVAVVLVLKVVEAQAETLLAHRLQAWVESPTAARLVRCRVPGLPVFSSLSGLSWDRFAGQG
jgi:hypothetical protein